GHPARATGDLPAARRRLPPAAAGAVPRGPVDGHPPRPHRPRRTAHHRDRDRGGGGGDAAAAAGGHPRARAPSADVTPEPLLLVGKPGCHLCEVMREVVSPVAAELGLALAERDVRSDPELDALYRNDIPDRKSTRLNSSHGWSSYAVFCL